MINFVTGQYQKYLEHIQSPGFGRTPFSPVFLTWRYLWRFIEEASGMFTGVVLDLGCGSKPYKEIISKRARYIGLDYPGVVALKNSAGNPLKPEIFADGMHLPFRRGSIDCIVNTQVIEYIAEPGEFVKEVSRVLKKNGVLYLTAPLTYPIHHVSHDFYRFTGSGLRFLLEKHGLSVSGIVPNGAFWIVLGQLLLYFLNFRLFYRKRHDIIWGILSGIRILATPLILAANVLINCCALVLDKLYPEPFITLNYSVTAKKEGDS